MFTLGKRDNITFYVRKMCEFTQNTNVKCDIITFL